MKITFDGILVEDAKPKEIADFIKAVRGKRVSSSKAGMYKLPAEITGVNKHNNIDMAWNKEELSFIMDNMDMSPRVMKDSPALSRRGNPAISAKKSAIKSGIKERMGNVAWKLYLERNPHVSV